MADGSGAPLALADLNKDIHHNTDLDPDEEYTGEIHVDSAGQKWPVIRRPEPVMEERPKRDADGEIMYHLRPDGSRHRPMREKVVHHHEDAEYIKMPLGNGIVQRNYHFRPSPGELERKELDQKNARARDEFEAMLRTGGKSIAEVVDAVKEAVGVAPHEDYPAESEADAEKPLDRFKRLKARAVELDMEIEGTGKKGALTLKDLDAAFAKKGATTVAEEATENTQSIADEDGEE